MINNTKYLDFQYESTLPHPIPASVVKLTSLTQILKLNKNKKATNFMI